MLPRPEVDAWTIEPIVAAPRGVWGKRIDRLRGAWSEYKAPTVIAPGAHHIDPSNRQAGRLAVDMHNLALERGYESELIRYRRPTAWVVTVRMAGTGDPSFMRDTWLKFGLDAPTSGGRE